MNTAFQILPLASSITKVFDKFYESFFQYFNSYWEKRLISFAGKIVGLVDKTVQGFFDSPEIKPFLNFFTWINLAVFTACIIVLLVDLAEEKNNGNPIEWGVVFMNVIKAYAFTVGARFLAVYSFEAINLIISKINQGTTTNFEDALNGLQLTMLNLADFTGSFKSGIAFYLICAVIYFFFQSLKRFGLTLVHIFTAFLYIPDIMRGETTKMGEWLRQLFSILLTYAFQSVLFFMGARFLIEQRIILAFICFTTMFSVAKLLNHYGWSSGTGGKFGSLISTIGQAASFIK